MNDADSYLPSVQAAARYGVCLKTLDRWTENDKLNFPQPLWINRRRFWRLADLHAWERAHVASFARDRGDASSRLARGRR